MSSYISINTSTADIRQLGGRLAALGAPLADPLCDTESAMQSMENFGDDKFGDGMRSSYPSDTSEIFAAKRELGEKVQEIGENCQTAMDWLESTEQNNTDNVNSVS